MVGKFHVPTHLENFTQLSDGNASAYLFFDTYEVEAHKKLFSNDNIFLANVRNIPKAKTFENKVLGLLSTGLEYPLSINILDKYVNDFIKVCNLYQTKTIDLRPHPAMDLKNNHGLQIADVMNSKGFICQLTSLENSVIDQAEGYVCIAGAASTALRDVRLFNQAIDIIGFESISLQYFEDPKFAFGSSAGIDWINCNGELIKSNAYNYNNKRLISEIIIDVYGD